MNRVTKREWIEDQHCQARAAKTADEIIARLKMTPPIDPLAIARTEYRLLRTGGGDLGGRYDGKLEFVKSRGLFLLYFNTKYDAGLPAGEHHPRTRFSISHELGHFFIDHHHQSLRRGVRPHRSLNEFRSHRRVEREADAFAASLLMPTAFARPMVNERQLSLNRVGEIARHFKASHVSTAIRSVRLSDFPCAIAGIRNGDIAWMFPSESLIAAGLYPRRGSLPENAMGQWDDMVNGVEVCANAEGQVGDWFETYGRDAHDDVWLAEEYLPVPVTGTLLALLTLDENDIAENDDDDGGDAD